MNHKKVLGITFAAVLMTATSANAQFGKSSSLADQVTQLREDVLVLQRESYRDKNSATGNTNFAVQVGEFDENLRQAIGKIDELEYKIKSLDDKIDMINKDMDIRIKMIEGKNIDSGGMNQPKDIKKFNAPVANTAPKSITGDSISKGEDLPPIQSESVGEIYQQGLDALKAKNSELAERNFIEILDKHPNDKLAGNAQYWLGESYYGQKQFNKAAVAFAKGYQKYKNSPKGADSLLKLGMSMQELGKKDEACAAFTSLDKEFPKAVDPLKEKAKSQAQKLGCK